MTLKERLDALRKLEEAATRTTHTLSPSYLNTDQITWLIDSLEKCVSALEWYANGMPWDDTIGNKTDRAHKTLKELEGT